MSKAKVIAGLGFGIAIGTAFGFYGLTPNVEGGPSGSSAEVQTQLTEVKKQRDEAEGQAKAADNVLTSVADVAVRNRLDGASVAVFVTSDAEPKAVDSVRSLIKDAGGTVTGTAKLTDKMLNPDSGDNLKSIAANSLPSGAKLSEKNLNPGMHTGQVLGAALQDGDKAASESDRAVVLGALTKDGYLQEEGDAPAPADLAVVITGNSSGDAGNGNYSTQFLADFAAGLDSRMGGVVLAGQQGSAEPQGALGMVRVSGEYKEEVSTVDNVDSEAGRITVIRALQQQKDKKAGHYGAAANASAPGIDK